MIFKFLKEDGTILECNLEEDKVKSLLFYCRLLLDTIHNKNAETYYTARRETQKCAWTDEIICEGYDLFDILFSEAVRFKRDDQ